MCLLLKAFDNRFCGKLPSTVKIKEKSPHVKAVAMLADLYLSGRGMVLTMIALFPRQFAANKFKLDNPGRFFLILTGP
jgi:hypothetical protein